MQFYAAEPNPACWQFEARQSVGIHQIAIYREQKPHPQVATAVLAVNQPCAWSMAADDDPAAENLSAGVVALNEALHQELGPARL